MMVHLFPLSLLSALFLTYPPNIRAEIDRQNILSSFSPIRTKPSNSTPLQVGNGNFAFSTDITGLQSLYPFNTLSSWGWHNSSLPSSPNQSSPSDFTGLDWWTHGRLVNYDQPNPAEADISQWLIGNPHRINLARVGFSAGSGKALNESDLTAIHQTLDLYDGVIYSNFLINGTGVAVQTLVDMESDTAAVAVESELLTKGGLAVFFDFPYATDKLKFEDPFVGVWNETGRHQTTLTAAENSARIQHTLDATTYFTSIRWSGDATVSGPLNGTHQYILSPGSKQSAFSFIATYGLEPSSYNADFESIKSSTTKWWNDYWNRGAFVDCTARGNSSALELQRRILLSQYLLAINGAGHDPPQESGLVNNGWYGKFHLEMVFWHLIHWARWGKWDLLSRAVPGVYERFLPSSIERARFQGYDGARWGKMSDPSGRSAPGEINSLLIWQQPHPMYFAELEYRSFPTPSTLDKWNDLLIASADFMVSFAFWNASTGVYDLGPPMYPVSENTNPNQTTNPTFELAQWRFGLDIAAKWMQRHGKPVPEAWTRVASNLAPLPVQNDTYVLYDGVRNFWTTPELNEDHPALLGINGWLPPPPEPIFNATIFANTVQKVYGTWNLTYSYGWDFPLLAMTAMRMGDVERAVEMLLHPAFKFDDVGMPVGGSRVPTPYFPGSSSLLLAVAMMAGGWDGSVGKAPYFPESWKCEVEGFVPGL